MQARESLEIRGVTDVNSFDEEIVILETICGSMTIEGKKLHVHVLDMEHGIVTLDGKIDAITYFEAETKKDGKSGLFGRLFR